MAARQTVLVVAILAMPFLAKGQSLTFNLTKPHKLFNEEMYNVASEALKNNANKLNRDQMDNLQSVGQALDTAMGEKIRNETGLTQTNSSNLEVALRQEIQEGKVSNLEMEVINQHAMAMRQIYVKEVIKVLDLQPSLFNLTDGDFCDVFSVCKSTTGAEKLGLDLTDHIKNITAQVDSEQADILQRRSDDSESSVIENVESTNNPSSTTELPKEVKEDATDAPGHSLKHSEEEMQSVKTDASTQGSSSASFTSLSKNLLLLLLVSSQM